MFAEKAESTGKYLTCLVLKFVDGDVNKDLETFSSRMSNVKNVVQQQVPL